MTGPHLRPGSGLALAAFGLASLATLLLGGLLTGLGLGPWYEALRVPSWQPPAWAFTPAWTTIFTLLAIAAWLVHRDVEGTPGARRIALTLYAIQLVLNAGWSLLFFALGAPGAALIEVLVLDLVLVAMVVAFARVSRPAGLLLLPYLGWLLFATAINAWIVLNNP